MIEVWQIETFFFLLENNSYNKKKGVMMPDQSTHGRFTPSAWNLIKKANLTEEAQDRLKLMIEAKTETITYDEAKAMLYTAVRQ